MEQFNPSANMKDIIFILGFFSFAYLFFKNYPIWKKTEQESKDKRASGFQSVVRDLTNEIKAVVKTSQDGTRVIQDSLSKMAEKEQSRHGEIMSCFGRLSRDNDREVRDKKV